MVACSTVLHRDGHVSTQHAFCSVQETVAGYPAAVLAKEAVYNAVSVGAFELHDYVDFSSWFRTALLAVRGASTWPPRSQHADQICVPVPRRHSIG